MLMLVADLLVFERVAHLNSFSLAAQALGVSVGAVSKQIARLEHTLGQALLIRTTRSLSLTEAGTAVLAQARVLATATHQVLEVSGKVVEPQGLLKVSVQPAFARTVLKRLLPGFLKAYPHIDVQLILTSQALDPALTSADLAIRICDKPPAGYLCQALMTVRHIACASAAYLQAHGTPTHPRDLKHHQCIRLGETPDDARWQFQRQTQTTTVQVSGRYQVNQAEMRLEAVMQHLGIACLPEYTLKPALADGRVVQVLPEWSFRSAYSGTAYAVYPDQQHMPSRLSVFLEYLAAEIYP